MQQVTLTEVHLRQLVMLIDHFGPEIMILSTLWMKGQI